MPGVRKWIAATAFVNAVLALALFALAVILRRAGIASIGGSTPAEFTGSVLVGGLVGGVFASMMAALAAFALALASAVSILLYRRARRRGRLGFPGAAVLVAVSLPSLSVLAGATALALRRL
jgi:hypothetical protein